MIYYNFGPHSRRTFNPKGAVMEYTLSADYKRIINASSGGSEDDMILTYENLEGKIISKEYNRLGLFETSRFVFAQSSLLQFVGKQIKS